MKLKNIVDPKNLPYAGALVQAVLFSIAGYQALPIAGWLVGLGAGAVVNYSIAFASSRVNEVAEKRRFMAKLMLYGMMTLSPITITLSLFMPASIFTAIAWAMCVDVAIVLAGATAGKSFVKDSDSQKPAQRNERGAQAGSAKQSGRSKSLSVAQVTVACRYAPQCDRTFTKETLLKANNAANGHARTCKFKPIETVLPVELQKIETKA